MTDHSKLAALRAQPSLGLVAPAAARAEDLRPTERTAWECGAYSAAHHLERMRTLIQSALAPGVVAVVALAYPHFWLWRLLLGAAAGLVVYWLIPLVWTAVVALRAPVIQRNALRDHLQRVGLSIELRAAADETSSAYVRVKEWHFARAGAAPADVERYLSEQITWFRDYADRLALTMEQSGLAQEAERYRVSSDDEGRTLAPAATHTMPGSTAHGRIESLPDLLNLLVGYRDSLTQLARTLVSDI